ncbi:MAG: hypothetical protein ACE5DX_01020 [Candidatus Dojkabacteria bacterium]
MMKNNKSTKIAVRLEPREKKLLFYFATRLGISPSALVRNQIKSMLGELEDKLADTHYLNVTKVSSLNGPTYTQDEIEDLFEIKK